MAQTLITENQLAAGLERLDREIEAGTYQPSRGPDRFRLMASDIIRWTADQGVETLVDLFHKNKRDAERINEEIAFLIVGAKAARGLAEDYAAELRALGHGDKVTPLKAFPDLTGERAQ